MVIQPKVRKVNLGEERSYNVCFDKLSKLGNEMSNLGLKGKALILSHSRVMKLHSKLLLEGLRPYFKTSVCELPEGEKTKSEDGFSKVLDYCQKNEIERKDTIICFGGGVIGDLGGYAAANWSRGTNVVQVPTTLLAQVDASIGGKTGIDWKGIKNKLGAFKQPKLVFTDITTLSTLSSRQFNNGMAEVIKYGILNAEIFSTLNSYKLGTELESRVSDCLSKIVWMCANLKCDFVEKDEFDLNGIRAKLNLGHTLGHAVEGASNFELLHGEAVSIGLAAAARLSARKLGLSFQDLKMIHSLLVWFNLPTKMKELDKKRVMGLMLSDKKVEDGKLNFVLFNKIGNVTFPHHITEKEVGNVLTDLS